MLILIDLFYDVRTGSILLDYLPTSVSTFIRNILGAKGGESSSSPSPPTEAEPPAVVEARNALQSAKEKLGEIEVDISGLKEDLESSDYGPEEVFRTLKDKCIRKDTGEYEYEHCFLDGTKQISKKGGPSVGMGGFQRVGSVDVDEVDAATGDIVKAPRTTLEYTNGQKCWNGPMRSTKVMLECGEKEEILQVREDALCVYSMVATSPAVCSRPEDGKDKAGALVQKDEL